MDKPLCGSLDTVNKSLEQELKEFFGWVAIVTAISTAWAYLTEGSAWFEKIVSFFGVSTITGLWVAAAAVAVVVSYAAWKSYSRTCSDQDGTSRCLSGVVNALHREEESVIPFRGDHPHVDLVIRSKYWNIISLNAKTVFCSETDDPDTDSPVLKAFFHSDEVCAAALGAAIGATVGAAVGAVAGVAVGGATLAACTLTGPFAFLCAAAALVLMALTVAIGAALGAALGGEIGRALSDGVDFDNLDGRSIEVGDFISVQGPTARNDDMKGAVVQFFVKAWAKLGAIGTTGEYSYVDAETGFVALDDQENEVEVQDCPVPQQG